MSILADLRKAVSSLEIYFDNRQSDPIILARKWATLPDSVQEMIFESCVNYISEVAERREFYGGMMPHYHSIAKDMLKKD